MSSYEAENRSTINSKATKPDRDGEDVAKYPVLFEVILKSSRPTWLKISNSTHLHQEICASGIKVLLNRPVPLEGAKHYLIYDCELPNDKQFTPTPPLASSIAHHSWWKMLPYSADLAREVIFFRVLIRSYRWCDPVQLNSIASIYLIWTPCARI
jgi:hypothetical protein